MNVWLRTVPGIPMPRWSYDDYRKAARVQKRVAQLLAAPDKASSPKVRC